MISDRTEYVIVMVAGIEAEPPARWRRRRRGRPRPAGGAAPGSRSMRSGCAMSRPVTVARCERRVSGAARGIDATDPRPRAGALPQADLLTEPSPALPGCAVRPGRTTGRREDRRPGYTSLATAPTLTQRGARELAPVDLALIARRIQPNLSPAHAGCPRTPGQTRTGGAAALENDRSAAVRPWRRWCPVPPQPRRARRRGP
jgi:hypothetical protein